MTVRPIDANAMLNELRPVGFEAEHSAVLLSDVSKMMREWVERQPTLTPPNEPLTLEQLREMDEIPIYVVTEKYGSGWCVLNWNGVKKSYTYFSRTGTSEGMTATPLSAKTYGDLWIAYRRPPEGDEDT